MSEPRVRPRRISTGPQTVLTTDERGRCSLHRIAQPDHHVFFVETTPDGVITLTPAKIVPYDTLDDEQQTELQTEAHAAPTSIPTDPPHSPIPTRMDDRSQGVDRGSFAQYADLDDEVPVLLLDLGPGLKRLDDKSES